MIVLMINLFIVTVSSTIAGIVSTKNKLYEKYFIFIALGSLIFTSGFRYKVGTDYMAYYKGYIVSKTESIFEAKDVGFALLNKILNYVSSNPQMIFFVTSIIINVCVVIFLYKNSNKFSLSIYFYITTFTYYSSMNGVRQFVATAIIALAYNHIAERRFFKYLLYVLIASTIHSSALIMIPIYFLVNQNVISIKNIYVILGSVITFIFFTPVFTWVVNNFERYSEYKDYLFNEGQGVNILRILVLLVPVIVMIIYIKRAKIIYGREIEIIINLCLIGSLFMIIAYKHMFIARFCIYFEFYYLLLLPRLCNMFDKKSNRIITSVVMVMYFLYSVMLLRAGDCAILPFRFNFN